MSNAWSESTHEGYSSGLLVWHVYCDKRSIPELQRAPAHPALLSSFVANLAGSYAGNTVSNYLYGVRAWHILHGAEQPYTVDFITKVGEQLNHEDPLDISVFACLTDGFYSVARVGKLTVPRLDAFNPQDHVTPTNLRTETNQSGTETTVLHVPKTKAAPVEGDDIYWTRQNGPTDPSEALANHFRINKPSNSDHLFAYLHKGCLRPLTKRAFIKRIAAAARAAGLEPLQGHGIRIGATLHYLLRGVPMEAMKVLGRWSSKAFMRYLRKHAQILTPYIQANPEAHRTFLQFIMPSTAMLRGRR
ncbi:hypothetical protein B0H34DRAFT_786577 [Crassisporium funariophilum]|nr:hypothetical protein B0H34DRAFT_786577 [Crassisporium funariophilum]